jgi:hypothetical protein
MDSSKMRYDLNKVPANTMIVSHFKDLAEHKEFNDKKNDTLLRIVIWSTDENSPFVIAERDDYERLINNICTYIKFTDKGVINGIIMGANTVFNQMVNRFFIMCDNLAYVMWKDKFTMFHYLGIALRAPVNMLNIEADMIKRANLDLKREQLHQSLIQYESQVFANTFTRKIIRKEVAKILQLAEKFAEPKGVI